MFPTEVQMKVLREELARELEQNALDQLARSQNEQPSLWSRLRERISTAKLETRPAPLAHNKTATA
jgi:hypothetical protein